MSWTKTQVRAMHQEHMEGTSLVALGRRHGVTHEAIRQLFIRHGLPRRSAADLAALRRAETERQVEEHREQIIALYKTYGSINAVREHVALPRPLITAVVNAIPNREQYRRRRASLSTPRDKLIADLHRAKQELGEPLSRMAYGLNAATLGLSALGTIERGFKDDDPADPWGAALRAAGIEGNPSRGRREGSITPQQCIEAVADCIADNDYERVSYDAYREWAKDKDVPSGPTVRLLVGWNQAVEAGLDSLHAV